MSGALDPVVQRAYDLGTVDEVLCRVCESDAERAAVKRVLGVEDQEARVAEAFSPPRPPLPEFQPQIDQFAVARDALARYTAWVDSHPDDDPTPLHARERALTLARKSVRRLEGDF